MVVGVDMAFNFVCRRRRRWKILVGARFFFFFDSFLPSKIGHIRSFICSILVAFERNLHENGNGSADTGVVQAHILCRFRCIALLILNTHVCGSGYLAQAVIYSLAVDAILISSKRMKCNFTKLFFSSSASYFVHLCIY